MSAKNADQCTRDVAAHIISQLLTTPRKIRAGNEAMEFLISYLLNALDKPGESDRLMSSFGISSSLKHLLKVSSTLKFFIASNGMEK